ncbi:tetratricopeptide repeat protein, partial [Kitasatospora sp. LaBMicrA B282]|uniref:tetratricopeptide repeat protein n=1 Tax=Kitasatospora sp. LaBMicrA B282 TaxID=3420949 RepID=UPI003D1021EF
MKGRTVLLDHHHRWVRAPHQAARIEARSRLTLPPVLAEVNAHRRLGGPYTAAGALLRALRPDALARRPELLARHRATLRAVEPPAGPFHADRPADGPSDLPDEAPVDGPPPRPALWTLRIAHGLTDFLLAHLPTLGGGPRTLVIDELHQADPTDQEWVGVLVRRVDPALLTVVVTTGTEPLAPPPRRTGPPVARPDRPAADPASRLERALTDCTDRRDHHLAAAPALLADPATSYVTGDGTTDDPQQLAAYQALTPRQRAALHDARHAELSRTAADHPALALGALVWHAEHGGDPLGAGLPALRTALEHCTANGFHHAAADYGARALALLDHHDPTHHADPAHLDPSHPDSTHRDPTHHAARLPADPWWPFLAGAARACVGLGRPDTALRLYERARADSAAPEVQVPAAAAIGLLHTHYPALDQQAHAPALGWLHQALGGVPLLADPAERALLTAELLDSLALFETRRGRGTAALIRLDQAVATLTTAFGGAGRPGRLARLHQHRARILTGLDRDREALTACDLAVGLDPEDAELRFDRGCVRHRLGQAQAALADYDRVLRLSPPFPEVLGNRADVRAALGDPAGAVADFGRLLELDPGSLDGYLNRAAVLAEAGRTAEAWRDLETGLRLAPTHVELLCLKGRLLTEEGRLREAVAALSTALAVDPEYPQAWALRGLLARRQGDLPAAVADLRAARARSADPEIAAALAAALAEQEAADRVGGEQAADVSGERAAEVGGERDAHPA